MESDSQKLRRDEPNLVGSDVTAPREARPQLNEVGAAPEAALCLGVGRGRGRVCPVPALPAPQRGQTHAEAGQQTLACRRGQATVLHPLPIRPHLEYELLSGHRPCAACQVRVNRKGSETDSQEGLFGLGRRIMGRHFKHLNGCQTKQGGGLSSVVSEQERQHLTEPRGSWAPGWCCRGPL